ncbi:hypothetical protein AB0M05_41480 [Streptomyces violaceusniger]|uniref:hypothetical protein n=1 Tax=Streptomyces violaceusniger TaxID=68280 RepID=UPI003424EC3B
MRAAVRDRAADRIRNGPRSKTDSTAGPRDKDRITLADSISAAIADKADERLKKRREKLDPPAVSKARGGKSKDTDGKSEAADGETTKDTDTESPPEPDASKKKSRRARRSHTPGGASGARPWRGRGAKGRKRPKSKRSKGKGPKRNWRSTWGRRRREPPRDTPRTDGEWLRPPPGWTVGYSTTITREDRPGPRPPAGTVGRGQPELGRGYRSLPAAPEPHTQRPGTRRPRPMPPARPTGGPVTVLAQSTQYDDDSELTIYDVIDSDADMAEEILAGVDKAQLVTDRCEELTSYLESLHAKIQDLKIPGVLEPMALGLIDNAQEVASRAEAVAEAFPAASEAIASAGTNAADRHKPLADAVRDAGHAAPAEAEYHDE